MAIMSILGLYSFDSSLFDLFCLPDEFTADEKNAVINNILMECSELEVLYPDPVFMKSAIGAWSFKEKPVWNRIYNASKLEYNPIENYRRTEQESITDEKTEQHSGVDSSTTSNTNTTQGSDSGDITRKVTGYDSNQLVTQGVDLTTGSSQATDTQSGQSALTHGEKIQHDGEVGRELLAFGNIGVTSSQDMLKQEIEIAPMLNVLNMIIESFKQRFCILIY